MANLEGLMSVDLLREYIPEGDTSGILYLRDSQWRDWYKLQKYFQDDTLKLVLDLDGRVVSHSRDVSMLTPQGYSVVEIYSDIEPDGPEWYYIQGVLAEKEPPEPDHRITRDFLLEKTDKFMLPDYHLKGKLLSEEQKVELYGYRQALRDAPTSKEWPMLPPKPEFLREIL